LLLKSITFSLALLALGGCGANSAKVETTQKPIIEQKSQITFTKQSQTDEVLATLLAEQAKEADSFEEFASSALTLLTPELQANLVNSNVQELLSNKNLLKDEVLRDALQEFYTEAHSEGRTTNATTQQTLFMTIKERLSSLIATILKPFLKSETSQADDVNLSAVKNQFQSVWNVVRSNELATLPQDSVSFFKLFSAFKNIILEDAQRTLSDKSDLLPHFEKLAHPNGVCMKGTWNIDSESNYSGYFKSGSQALIIARASSAMSNTKKGEIRAFGMAGKLFATTDTLETLENPSANFFVIDDLGGTKADYFSDVELTNEPSVSTNSEVLKYALYALKVANAFRDADVNPNIRQVYEISHLGESNNSNIITPKWMKISAQEGQTKVNATDFREEFFLDENETLTFNIDVASNEVNGTKVWQHIGTIVFDEAVVSLSCDHNLHFHHPRFRTDLKYQ